MQSSPQATPFLSQPFTSRAEGVLPGWQHQPGEKGDRDLKFVDTMIGKLRDEYSVDMNRIYATGFSNGGFFCYVLWAERPQVFAAVLPARRVASVS